jgi:hypothetical protein
MNVLAQENRRHRRLVKKAARLDVKDLLEIASMKGVANAAGHAASSPLGGSDGGASSASGSACSGNAGGTRAPLSVASGVGGIPEGEVVMHGDAAGPSSEEVQNEQDDNTREEPVTVAPAAGPGARL